MTGWDELRSLLDNAAALEQVAQRVLELSADERKEVATALPAYLRSHRDDWRWMNNRGHGLRVVGAGCISGPAAAATWLGRRDLNDWRDTDQRRLARLVVRVTAGRGDAWQAEVGRRLSARLRITDQLGGWRGGATWEITAHLIRSAGARPPQEDAFAAGWVSRWRTALEEVPEDPFFAAMVPRMFEVEGIGRMLSWDHLDHQNSWTGTLLAHVDRKTLLDGCVRRFLRGGTAADMRWFVRLYEAADPTVEESAARLRDLVRLLPVAVGPVAEPAFAQIRIVDDVAPLEAELFTEVAESLLFRPEKKLVRTAMTWLDRTARRRDRVDATVSALATAFKHEGGDLRERAVKLALKQASRISPEVGEAVREAAATLSSDLRVQIADAFGPVEAPDEPPPMSLYAPAPSDLPPPIASTAELAEETAAYLRHRGRPSWIEGERLLAGLVTLGPSSVDALERVVQASAPWLFDDYYREHADDAQRVLLTLLRPSKRHHLLAYLKTAMRARPTPAGSVPAPERVISARFSEAAASPGAWPVLLATPTISSGHIDPDVLVERLRVLENAGTEPGVNDFEQALLRLPRDVGPLPAAASLRSKAGAALRAWLAAGGLPDVEVKAQAVKLPMRSYSWNRQMDATRFVATASFESDLATVRALCDLPIPENGDSRAHYVSGIWWPAVLPSHREIIAAHVLSELTDWTSINQGELLLGLAEADGPTGAATAAALAYGLTAESSADRAASVDALLSFAARDALPAAELGKVIATLHQFGQVTLTRLASAFAQAAQAGVPLWPVFETMIPGLLPSPGQPVRPGLGDLLSLATTAAEGASARNRIPELDQVTQRGGTSRLVREATRLHRALAA